MTKYDPTYYPGKWALDPNSPASSPQGKSQNLAAVYPEKDKYVVLPADRYYSPDVMRLEWDAVWSKVWTCAGLVSDATEVGAWFKYDLGAESFIIVRGEDQGLRAFYNVCQHRGRKLVTEDFGKSFSFVCPFHSWAFDLEGRNIQVTDREFFTEQALAGDLNLREVRCETWGGFVFISMDDNAQPLVEWLGPLPAQLADYRSEDMFIVKDVAVSVDCNWKIAAEAFLEPYHAHITHPQILPAVDEMYNQYDFYENGHGRVITPVGMPSPRFEHEDMNPALAYMLDEAGIDPTTFKGGAPEVREALWAAKRKPDNTYGLDYSPFLDSQLTDDWNPSFFPNMTFNAHPEGFLVMRFMPHKSDPKKSIYCVWVMLARIKEGIRPPGYFGVEDWVDITGATRPERRYTDSTDPQVGEVLEQDIAHMRHVQDGVASKGFRNGVRLSEYEGRLQQSQAEMDRLARKLL